MTPPNPVPKQETPCPECQVAPPGHKIFCKTGNERARRYQKGLEDRYRKHGKRSVSRLSVKNPSDTRP